jgi:adenylate cyclase
MIPVRIEFTHRGPRHVKVDGECTVGRSPECDVAIAAGANLSRRHVVLFETSDGKLMLRDLGSRNGTWVENKKVEGEIALLNRARVCMGSEEIFLTWPADASLHGEPPIEADEPTDINDSRFAPPAEQARADFDELDATVDWPPED